MGGIIVLLLDENNSGCTKGSHSVQMIREREKSQAQRSPQSSPRDWEASEL